MDNRTNRRCIYRDAGLPLKRTQCPVFWWLGKPITKLWLSICQYVPAMEWGAQVSQWFGCPTGPVPGCLPKFFASVSSPSPMALAAPVLQSMLKVFGVRTWCWLSLMYLVVEFDIYIYIYSINTVYRLLIYNIWHHFVKQPAVTVGNWGPDGHLPRPQRHNWSSALEP